MLPTKHIGHAARHARRPSGPGKKRLLPSDRYDRKSLRVERGSEGGRTLSRKRITSACESSRGREGAVKYWWPAPLRSRLFPDYE